MKWITSIFIANSHQNRFYHSKMSNFLVFWIKNATLSLYYYQSMYEEQARINATISYFFLGPIFLLARSGSPLADPYVRTHAKRSCYITGVWLLGYMIYFFLKPFLIFAPFGIPLTSIVLSAIIATMVGYLIFFAYRAFVWDAITPSIPSWKNGSFLFFVDLHEKSDDEKVRIIASFVPLLGIWVSSKYNDNVIQLGRKIGSFIFFVIIFSSLFLDWSTGISLILTFLLILLIVYSGVSLFLRGNLPIFQIYSWIPSYREFEAHIKTGFMWGFKVMTILGGSEGWVSYTSMYNENLSSKEWWTYENSFVVSPRFIGVPIINLITIPSLFQEKYREYTPVILQWILLTFLFVMTWFMFGFRSEFQLFLLIPLVHILSFAHLSPSTRAPWVDIILFFSSLFTFWRSSIQTLKKKEEIVNHLYTEVKEEIR